MQINKIRQTFLDYFCDKGHAIVASSSLVPVNDPTLLFTNAGMNQFKEVFLGNETMEYNRAASSQCCVRAGGKHNDLENVGYTARHHTFFEMLGNFSFGDYFKREAINYAWEFLTKILQISPEKLSVTVYEEDREAEKIWLDEIKIDPKKLSRCGKKDNFWAMGDTGPCGPCSEIFYDHGVGQDDDRYVEIWNLVFMQFNRSADGRLTPLPQPSVDTGMGLERIAAVMQGVHNNYDIDIFKNLIKAILDITKVKNKDSKSLQVIADHIRSSAFLIAAGVIPSNEGRGYVLRRIIRRAIRHAHKLGIDKPFFFELVAPLGREMGEAYPQLIKSHKLIARMLYQEELQFATTLQHGLKLLEQEIANIAGKIIPGDVVFRLYDTYGFPLDLTADIARERGLSIDNEGFEMAMNKQRTLSQKSNQFEVDYNKIPKFEGVTEFIGYEDLSSKATVLKLLKDDVEVKELLTGESGLVILDRTPFYAESGGQSGDIGRISNKEACFSVRDTQKQGAIYLHYGEITQGKLGVADKVVTAVSDARRVIAANHTATHILHAALRQILGSHVEQKGSAVDAKRLRFDFSHFEAVSTAQIIAVEQLVNSKIRANLPVVTEVMGLEQAKQQGATALFGEKYAREVRVVQVGDYSLELCGGTHIKSSGEIGVFKIMMESAIAAGVRRIEAITGATAFDYLQHSDQQLKEAAVLLKTEQNSTLKKLQQVLQHNVAQTKEIMQHKADWLKASCADLARKSMLVEVNMRVLILRLDGFDNKLLRYGVELLTQKLGSSAVILFTVDGNKIQLVAGINKDKTGKLDATELVRYVATKIGGTGGGKKDMAQGGGTNVASLQPTLDSVYAWIAKKIE